MKKLSTFFILLNLIFLAGIENAYAQNDTRPNILLVLLDDARYQDYAATGGPSWFVTPTIDRIANEGANFKKDYVVLSLCEPSRVSIFTGKYPHHNGFTDNFQPYDTSTLTIARILRENGYYTGLVGKFLNSFETFPSADYDYWCAYDGKGTYLPKVFNLNGIDTLIPEQVSVAINDYAVHFLESVPPEKPFYLMISTKAPHPNYVAYPGYENAYHDEQVPFPTNFEGYTKNYPSYIYYDNEFLSDSAGCVDEIQRYYEDLIGVEVGLDSIFSILESSNQLDSTLIIYTSDNGVFIGEHHMQKKRLAYEESMHVPLFARYPAWFAPNTVIDDQFALNIDLFPTFLDAAGITDTFNDDGVSLRALVMQEQQRKIFLFEYFSDTTQKIPDFRCVRSLQYKYIWSSCDQVTEEFYDLVNDPKEDTNQIFNPAYSSLIQDYRYKLDSIRLAVGDDPANDTIIPCSLLNVDTIYLDVPARDEPNGFTLSPDPVAETLTVHFPPVFTGEVKLSIRDMEGILRIEKNIFLPASYKISEVLFPVKELMPGVYIMSSVSNTAQHSMIFVKE